MHGLIIKIPYRLFWTLAIENILVPPCQPVRAAKKKSGKILYLEKNITFNGQY